MIKEYRSLLVALGAVASLTLAAACAETTSAERGPGASTPAADDLRDDMRELWTEHVVWTRDYIVASIGRQPDAKAAASRLMKNQEDIGKAVGEYYGAAAGDQLTTLLKEHINGAVIVIDAAMADDKPALKVASDNWSTNAMEIADFLSKANPNWSRSQLSDLMKTHLETTTDEVTARLKKDWDADVRAFDKVYDHILMMSDAISDGIVKQFPDRFGTRPAAK